MVHAMARPTSDHVPFVVHIDTVIPKVNLFIFENFWVDQPGFYDCVKLVWDKPTKANSSAAILVEKLKMLRFELKKWRKSLAKLKLLISNFDMVILFFDQLEEVRALSIHERNFRKIVKKHYDLLIKAQHQY